jgi:hypothetical protein
MSLSLKIDWDAEWMLTTAWFSASMCTSKRISNPNVPPIPEYQPNSAFVGGAVMTGEDAPPAKLRRRPAEAAIFLSDTTFGDVDVKILGCVVVAPSLSVAGDSFTAGEGCVAELDATLKLKEDPTALTRDCRIRVILATYLRASDAPGEAEAEAMVAIVHSVVGKRCTQAGTRLDSLFWSRGDRHRTNEWTT